MNRPGGGGFGANMDLEKNVEWISIHPEAHFSFTEKMTAVVGLLGAGGEGSRRVVGNEDAPAVFKPLLCA